MLQAGWLRGDAVLALLLATRVVAAFEPITVGIAIGAASAITGYLTYNDIYCRFAECCREERPLNASAAGRRCWGRRGTGARPLDGGGGGPGNRSTVRALEAAPSQTASRSWASA
ncbi:hypothetical protein P7K49_001828 [Saguinus oedipus]|uniref:Uncharacterized protein n=1 Tax=Saguinus oedipus TaxID=9490 RepID=A0ABQ9WJH2_SAGOE|nr:hypothetical protein P7K49_001828 [Saguinus oedipus]